MALQTITGTLRCPPVRVLRSAEYNAQIAHYLVDLGLSGDGTLDWVLTQIYDHFDGTLVGYDGKEIDLESRYIDDDFGTDTRRQINAYKMRALREFKQRLHVKMLRPVSWMHFAIEIHKRLERL